MQNGSGTAMLNSTQSMLPFQLMQQAYALRQMDYYQQTLMPYQQQTATNSVYHYGVNINSDNLNLNPSVHRKTNFSIDSILNRDSNSNQDTKNSRAHDSMTYQFADNSTWNYNHIAMMQRRHERLTEASHPYLASDKYANSSASNNDKCGRKSRGSEWRCGRSKRIRTIFTPEQLERLELEFERQQYMVGTERYYLAAELSLTEAQVKVWYQNRRIKWRKQNLEKQHAKLASSELYNHVVDSGCSDADDITPDTSRSSISPNNDSYNIVEEET